MKKGQTENTYPASEEPLVQALIEMFFEPPVADDRTILHKNGKVTRNGYEVVVISSSEELNRSRKQKGSIQPKRKFKYKKEV